MTNISLGILLACFFTLGISTFNQSYAAFPGKKQQEQSISVQNQNSQQQTLNIESISKDQSSAADDTALLIILAILIPPLAVYLYFDEWNKTCTINLILTLLCGLPGVIHALIVILGKK